MFAKPLENARTKTNKPQGYKREIRFEHLNSFNEQKSSKLAC
jgi:hypothetical protein